MDPRFYQPVYAFLNSLDSVLGSFEWGFKFMVERARTARPPGSWLSFSLAPSSPPALEYVGVSGAVFVVVGGGVA